MCFTVCGGGLDGIWRVGGRRPYRRPGGGDHQAHGVGPDGVGLGVQVVLQHSGLKGAGAQVGALLRGHGGDAQIDCALHVHLQQRAKVRIHNGRPVFITRTRPSLLFKSSSTFLQLSIYRMETLSNPIVLVLKYIIVTHEFSNALFYKKIAKNLLFFSGLQLQIVVIYLHFWAGELVLVTICLNSFLVSSSPVLFQTVRSVQHRHEEDEHTHTHTSVPSLCMSPISRR